MTRLILDLLRGLNKAAIYSTCFTLHSGELWVVVTRS